MARKFSNTRFRTDSKRRKSTWVGPANQNTVAVATGASVIIGSFTPSTTVPSMNEPTVIRTRGECVVKPQAITATVSVSGAFGVGIVTDQAFVAGAGSIPRPFDDAGWDGWFMWQSFSFENTVIDATGFQSMIGRQYQVDSKAMRKIQAGETMVLMAESQTGAFNIAMHLRLLFLLS